ncbi:MAG TPA: hypothetical protein VI365_28985, partial [Trebonia sp.]
MSRHGDSATIQSQRSGRLLTISLDRPGRANAFDLTTAALLRDAVCSIDDGVGCVLLRGEGA